MIGNSVSQNIELHTLTPEVATKVSRARSHSFFIKEATTPSSSSSSAGVRQYPGAKLKIAILSSADVAGWYFATLLQRGHQAIFVGGHPPSAVDQMILEAVEGILILSDEAVGGDECLVEANATSVQRWEIVA
jgi:hypothetical protein